MLIIMWKNQCWLVIYKIYVKKLMLIIIQKHFDFKSVLVTYEINVDFCKYCRKKIRSKNYKLNKNIKIN